MAEHGARVIEQSIFLLDNEPNYWSGTHRDVHPQPFSYDELFNKTLAYATALKAKHAGVRIGGPATSSYQALSMPAVQRLGGSGATLTLAEALVRDVGAHYAATGVKLLQCGLRVDCGAVPVGVGKQWLNEP